jgi:hypothetical protein
LAYARKKLDDYREASIQAFTSEAIKDYIQKTVAGALVAKSKYNAGEAHLTSKDIAGKIRGKLLDQIGGGDFIRINGKNYNLKSYAELVARTRMRESQTDATIAMCEEYENDLVQIDKHDNPCEEVCAEYQGKVFSISGKHPDYPELPDGGPPFHPRCVLPGTRIKAPGGIIAGLRAWYDGQAVELVLASGARVSVTVNHLFPTLYGFAPAHLLREGDDVFYSADPKGVIPADPNDDGEPTLIEKIVGSLAKASGVASAIVPATPEYLHGDGRFCNGDIDIIGANRFLLGTSEATLAKRVSAGGFNGANVDPANFSGFGDLALMLKGLALTADGLMGGRRAPSPFFLARTRGGHGLPFGCTPQGDAVSLQDSADGHIGIAALPGQVNGSLPGLVPAHDFGIGQGAGESVSPEMAFAEGAELNPCLPELSADRLRVHANSIRDFAEQHSGLIHLDKIIKVNIFPYCGHVYDLHTFTSLYICNGIVSSNCECSANPTSETALRWRNK